MCTQTTSRSLPRLTRLLWKTHSRPDFAQAADEANVGAVQRTLSWQELAVLLSGYDYAAIVLVDSRFLHPGACRTPTPALAPASPAAASTSSAPSLATHSLSPPWSTPKRQREDGDGDVCRGGADGTGGDEKGGAPSRRRRRRPRAQGGFDDRSDPAITAKGAAKFPSVSLKPDPAALLSVPLSAQGDEHGPDARETISNLRVRPAPHAVEGDGTMMSSFATPSPRNAGRKSLGSIAVDTQEHDVPQGSAAFSLPSFTAAPTDNTETGSPARSPQVLASPPPLKSAAFRAPISTTGGSSSPRASHDPSASADSSYCGHYILLVGWSEANRMFIARDPGLSSSPESSGAAGVGSDPNAHVFTALTPEVLDRARHSCGTDDDVLVVDLARSRRGVVATPLGLAAAAATTALAASAASSAAMVGLIAMAAAAAAAGAEGSVFKEWGWPDPVAWFGGHAGGGGSGCGDGGGFRGGTSTKTSCAGVGVDDGEGLTQGGTDSAAKRLASLLSARASGWRFPTVGDAYRGPRVLWRNGGMSTGGDRTEAEAAAEGERWAVRMASAMEGLLQGGRRAAYTVEGLFQGGTYTMEGLMQVGRRGAYTMEGLLEGGRRAAYSLRDSLADVADAPGGAGAECYVAVAWNSPASPASPSVGAVMSPA